MNSLILLAKTLGLNENSKDTADFIATKIEYCEDHKDEITYSTKEERLGTLSKRYKKLEEKASLAKIQAKADQSSKSLAERFKRVRSTVLDYYNTTGLDLRPAAQNATTKEKLFTEEEIAALDELGSIPHQVELSQLHKLEEELTKLYMNNFIQKASYNALTAGEQRIAGLLNG